MNARRPTEDIESLWAIACDWADRLTAFFGEPDALARVGLSRRLALQCCNWLWSIEGVMRRLIIAAALAFDISKLAPQRPPRTPGDHKTSSTAPRPPGFRVFAFAADPRTREDKTGRSGQPYGHVPFPADTLLRIGATRGGHHNPAGVSSATPHHHNPLRRRGRISRYHPDYRGVSEEASHRARRHSPRTGPRPRTKPASVLFVVPDLSDWRRIEAEWQRTLPAPHLARRITVLLRVVENPTAWVRRLARRLHKSNLAARLIGHPPPRLRRPKLDRSPPTPLLSELAQAQVLVALDTS